MHDDHPETVPAAEQDSAPAAEPAGLECRACGCRDFRVHMTRPRPNYILRIRLCRHCGRKLTTRERPV